MSIDTVRPLPEDKLIQQALEALMAALGPVETTRFLSLTRTGRVESVARHQQWQSALDRKPFFDEVFGQTE